MIKAAECKKWAAPLFLFVCAALITVSPVMAEPELQSVSQTVEGGKGLLYMQSARTYGSSAFLIGAKALYQRRDYPVWGKDSYNTDNTTILSIPVTIGLTDYLDVTGAVYGFHDARPYLGRLRYGEADYGLGSVRASAKLRYPFPMEKPLQVALKVGAMFDTSDMQLDGLNYRWGRQGTDYDVSLLQTFDFGRRFSLHLEEGYTVSGAELFDDQWVGAVGLELRANDRWTFGLEANNRTFDGVSPQSVFKAGLNPSKYWDGPRHAGMYYYIKERKADRWQDFFVVVPSASYRLSEKWALDFGAIINAADQEDPRETVQLAVGLSYGTILPWFADSDKDGVKNRHDREPNTPLGYPVDQYGVSLDSDGDGVPDGRDQEKNTPRGARVDPAVSASIRDGDGVYDGLDKEPNTPRGYPVDKFGVALDSDGDGVPDGKDREPNTPKGYPVDEYGVSLDTDGDGVPDGRDKEPNTPRGSRVDEFGRAIKEQERKLVEEGVISLNAVYFDIGKAVIKPESFEALNEVVDVLRKYPNIRIEIQGHTDNTGSAALNRRLSTERAQAVLEYILKRDSSIIRSNFTVAGYGPDRPVASNATIIGRQANRRVDFVVLNRDALQRR
jgi:outer membrane protein OmpA-like peptidoglycan-associated protein